jgi:hypothetical protein
METVMNGYADALARAKAKFTVVRQTGKNPFFKSAAHPQGSPYSTLQDIDEATSAALTSEGFAPVQCDVITTENGLLFEGTLAHKDGGTKTATVPLLFAKQDMQSLKGAITYATRIVTVMLTGCVSGEADDDGNAAANNQQPAAVKGNPAKRAVDSMTAENELRQAINAGDEAAAKKAMDKVRLRAKRKEIDEGLLQRAEAAFEKAFPKEELANV